MQAKSNEKTLKIPKQFFSVSAGQTKNLGKSLAKQILKTKPAKVAVVMGLVGDLGGGKTTFLQGFASGLGIQEKILSPTFVLMKRFKIKNSGFQFKDFYHIDCYRLRAPQEILALGFREIVASPNNIVAVEWSERILKLLPQGTVVINFDFIDKNTRKISFSQKNV